MPKNIKIKMRKSGSCGGAVARTISSFVGPPTFWVWSLVCCGGNAAASPVAQTDSYSGVALALSRILAADVLERALYTKKTWSASSQLSSHYNSNPLVESSAEVESDADDREEREFLAGSDEDVGVKSSLASAASPTRKQAEADAQGRAATPQTHRHTASMSFALRTRYLTHVAPAFMRRLRELMQKDVTGSLSLRNPEASREFWLSALDELYAGGERTDHPDVPSRSSTSPSATGSRADIELVPPGTTAPASPPAASSANGNPLARSSEEKLRSNPGHRGLRFVHYSRYGNSQSPSSSSSSTHLQRAAQGQPWEISVPLAEVGYDDDALHRRPSLNATGPAGPAAARKQHHFDWHVKVKKIDVIVAWLVSQEANNLCATPTRKASCGETEAESGARTSSKDGESESAASVLDLLESAMMKVVEWAEERRIGSREGPTMILGADEEKTAHGKRTKTKSKKNRRSFSLAQTPLTVTLRLQENDPFFGSFSSVTEKDQGANELLLLKSCLTKGFFATKKTSAMGSKNITTSTTTPVSSAAAASSSATTKNKQKKLATAKAGFSIASTVLRDLDAPHALVNGGLLGLVRDCEITDWDIDFVVDRQWMLTRSGDWQVGDNKDDKAINGRYLFNAEKVQAGFGVYRLFELSVQEWMSAQVVAERGPAAAAEERRANELYAVPGPGTSLTTSATPSSRDLHLTAAEKRAAGAVGGDKSTRNIVENSYQVEMLRSVVEESYVYDKTGVASNGATGLVWENFFDALRESTDLMKVDLFFGKVGRVAAAADPDQDLLDRDLRARGAGAVAKPMTSSPSTRSGSRSTRDKTSCPLSYYMVGNKTIECCLDSGQQESRIAALSFFGRTALPPVRVPWPPDLALDWYYRGGFMWPQPGYGTEKHVLSWKTACKIAY